MARRPPPPPERQMKRRAGFEEWMEEDDLLDSGYPERDLRHKLQRGGGNRSGEDSRFGFRDHRREEQQHQGNDRRERAYPNREGESRATYHPRVQRESWSGPGGKFDGKAPSRPDLRKELDKAKNKANSSQSGSKTEDSSVFSLL